MNALIPMLLAALTASLALSLWLRRRCDWLILRNISAEAGCAAARDGEASH